MRTAVIACGKRLYKRGLVESIEDVNFLNFHELVEIMEALVLNEKIAKYHYGAMVPNLVKERKVDCKMAEADSEAPLTFGNLPEKMTDPIGVKVFGILTTSCILRAKGKWQSVWKDFRVLRALLKGLRVW